MTQLTRSALLADYIAELAYAIDLKEDGTETIHNSACEHIANGRTEIPIDEYIAMWQNGINVLASDAEIDIDDYNY